MSLVYGEHYPLPLPDDLFGQLCDRLGGGKRVIAVAHFALETAQASLPIIEMPIKSVSQLVICNFVASNAGNVVTARGIQASGMPLGPNTYDDLALARKNIKRLNDRGLEIKPQGSRHERTYLIPKLRSALLQYVEDPDELERLLNFYVSTGRDLPNYLANQ